MLPVILYIKSWEDTPKRRETKPNESKSFAAVWVGMLAQKGESSKKTMIKQKTGLKLYNDGGDVVCAFAWPCGGLE